MSIVDQADNEAVRRLLVGTVIPETTIHHLRSAGRLFVAHVHAPETDLCKSSLGICQLIGLSISNCVLNAEGPSPVVEAHDSVRYLVLAFVQHDRQGVHVSGHDAEMHERSRKQWAFVGMH